MLARMVQWNTGRKGQIIQLSRTRCLSTWLYLDVPKEQLFSCPQSKNRLQEHRVAGSFVVFLICSSIGIYKIVSPASMTLRVPILSWDAKNHTLDTELWAWILTAVQRAFHVMQPLTLDCANCSESCWKKSVYFLKLCDVAHINSLVVLKNCCSEPFWLRVSQYLY
jgi:hypothetical protein